MGRPLGIPRDPVFQKRVLLSALKLLEAEEGPVLEDFFEEAPSTDTSAPVWACPVSFIRKTEELNDFELLRAALAQEVAELRAWYDLGVKKRGRTTFGVSGLELGDIVVFIGAFLDGTPENPRADLALGLTLNFAVDDLKAYYYEAVTSQPGHALPESTTLDNWFWRETAASKILRIIRKNSLRSEDPIMKLLGKVLLVPMAQVQKK